MSLIGSEVKPFSASAFHNGEFVDLTDANLRGKWSVVCFYPADFTFVCPTELEDLQTNTQHSKRLTLKFTLFQQIRISHIKHGTKRQKQSVKSSTS